MRLGIHVSIGGGLGKAVRHAAEIGCESLQIFASNPGSWRVGKLDQGEAAAFRDAAAQSGIHPIVLHTPYLINMASQSPSGWANSCGALASALTRAHGLGARYVVTHIGSHGGAGFESVAPRVRDAVLKALDQSDGAAVLLLEGSAGSGNTLGASFEELAHLLSLVRERRERVGVCLDTAHMFGAGYDLSGADGATATIDRFDRIVGMESLGVLHLNDTQKELASRVDRHWHIGKGRIGLEGFRALVNDPRLTDVPGILETPGMEEGFDTVNLDALKALRG